MEREPLPYPHHPGPHGGDTTAACALPEDPRGRKFLAWDTCPGCRAYTAARIARNPQQTSFGTNSGTRGSTLDRFRDSVPDYDPVRVLLERHLARG